MRSITAGAIGGVAAGMIVSGAMVFGCDAGLLHETLADDAQNWLDRNFDTRRQLGEDGAALLEQLNHMAASAVFGAAYGAVRPVTRFIPPMLSGALFGWGLYGVAIGKLAPAIGLTEGEDAAESGQSAERLGLHLLFGVVTALAAEAMAPPKRRRPKLARQRGPNASAAAA